MKIIQILHHSISPLAGQYPEKDPLRYNSGFPMKYARAIRSYHPDVAIECWRPERATRQECVWIDEPMRITHRIFPSRYARYNLEYSHAMLRAIKEEAGQSDACFAIHGAYNLHAYLLAPMLSASSTILQSHGGFPAHVLFHRSRHRQLRSVYLMVALLERLTLPKYRHIFAISQEERTYLNQLCSKDTIHFSPTGTDFLKFSPGSRQVARSVCGLAEDQRVLLYVGRLTAEKGLEYLLEALAIIVNRLGQGPKLVIVGSGPLRDVFNDASPGAGCGSVRRFHRLRVKR